jgi:hypothetical protein
MDTATKKPSKSSTDDLVILVHGTYAARDPDEGDSWWQRGSLTWRDLSDLLPAGATMPERGILFHWSGENSERARNKAAGDLLAHLLELESEGRRYHLIGHSHGGSVIWQALCQAKIQRKSLAGLLSWSTVGTPFLHHRTRSAWHLANILNILLAIALFKPAARTLCNLVQLAASAMFGLDHGIKLASDGGTGWYATARSPALRLLEMAGVPVTETAEGIRVGTYDPTGGQSFVEYFFFSAEGWLILTVAIAAAYVYLNLVVFFISPVLESLRIRKEKRLEQNVINAYRGRWLGIWAPDDEAINGLRATLGMSISFVARMVPRESVWFSDRLLLISRPYHYLLAPVYNRLFRPVLDGIVRSHVTKTAQGNNRPSAEVIAVSPTPIEQEDLMNLPPMPDWLSAKITEEANRHASGMAPKLRALLAQPSFVSGLETFGTALSGRELVHTSYFEHAEVLQLLAMHIAWGRGDRAHLIRLSEQETYLIAWLRLFKARMGERLIPLSNSDDEMMPAQQPRVGLQIPRRRAA